MDEMRGLHDIIVSNIKYVEGKVNHNKDIIAMIMANLDKEEEEEERDLLKQHLEIRHQYQVEAMASYNELVDDTQSFL